MERITYGDTVKVVKRPISKTTTTIITRGGEKIIRSSEKVDGPWEFSGISVTVAAVLHHFGRTPSINPVMTYPVSDRDRFSSRVSYTFKTKNSGYRLVVYGLRDGAMDYTDNSGSGLMRPHASRLTAMWTGQDFVITPWLEAEDQWGKVSEFGHFPIIQVIPRKCNRNGLSLKFRLSTPGKMVKYSDLYDHCLGVRRCSYLTRVDDVEDPTYLGF